MMTESQIVEMSEMTEITDYEKENKDRKKRNSRKRNRCDMSPEELQRLRERERKAQQNRRDRIRAQKLLQQKNERVLPATMVNMSNEMPTSEYSTSDNGLPPLMKVHGSPSIERVEERSSKSSKIDDVYLDATPSQRNGEHDINIKRESNSFNGSPKFESRSACVSPDARYRPSSERVRHSPNDHISPSSYLPARMFDSHVIPRSFSSHRYLDEGRYLADLHYHQHAEPHRLHRHVVCTDSPPEKHYHPSFYHSSEERKRMVSRNVDRKKLTEEELEDLRRRERDYQRERRARIRLEKAKSSIEEENFFRHYHRESAFHFSEDHYRPKYFDVHAMYSPHSPPSRKLEKRHPSEVFRESESHGLSVSIPHSKVSNDDDGDKETELLQVVPKNRDYEHLKVTSPEFHLKSSSSPVNGEKKSALENICTTLKRETISVKKITEDQLERRRKSNREAQRRRRARLKMIEERPISALDNSSESVASDGISVNSSFEEERLSKKCRVKVTPNRPDSLYPEDFAYYPNDKYITPLMKEIKSKRYPYDMKQYNEKTALTTPHVVPFVSRESLYHSLKYHQSRHSPPHSRHSPPSHSRHSPPSHSRHSPPAHSRHSPPSSNRFYPNNYQYFEKEKAMKLEKRLAQEMLQPKEERISNPVMIKQNEEEVIKSRKRKQFVPRKFMPGRDESLQQFSTDMPSPNSDKFDVTEESPDFEDFEASAGETLNNSCEIDVEGIPDAYDMKVDAEGIPNSGEMQLDMEVPHSCEKKLDDEVDSGEMKVDVKIVNDDDVIPSSVLNDNDGDV